MWIHIVWSVRQVLQVLLALLVNSFLQDALQLLEPSLSGKRVVYLGLITLVTGIIILLLSTWFPYDEYEETTKTTSKTTSLNNRVLLQSD
jgi:hypothetical protein